ncbi:MAG: phosphonate ABC transporter, permease protein PhnE [Armatimonadota bacterium]|nr:phosphonate ABC transporter, permease protein PhnE [Armatimonadota bacterium]MDR5703786.1 phosphonate ABC transporter, permease protein PhnE [Armatimonadota bacterium]MDR7434936.1 phosphonate ABC transporter, permease protein PhnE [Armatimonadota bacterium]
MRNQTVTPKAIPHIHPGRRSLIRSWQFLMLLLAILLIYGYGWRVTQINMGELFTKAHLIRPLLSSLVRPDLLTRDQEVQVARAPFLTGEGELPTLPPSTEGTSLNLSRTRGRIGDRLVVRGQGFRPNTEGVLWWENQIGQRLPMRRFKTDEQGRFTLEIAVPQTPGVEHVVIAEVSWPVGPLKPSETLKIVTERMIETVFLALMGTTIAVVVAVPLSFLGARNLMARNPVGFTIYLITRTVFNIARSIEPLIMATVFAVWVGIGPFAGVLALGVHSIAALGKLYSEQIESIDPGPIEAVMATGATPLQVVRYAVIPQIVPQFIAFTIYRWDINVRMSTVIGFVGGGGIGFILMQYINLLQWRQAATAVWAITLVVALMDYASAVIREKVI